MATPAPTEPMPAEQSAALAEFARSCKTAARSVSLYPATHPAIKGALGRVVTASQRLTGAGDVTIAILPDLMVIEGKAPAKPDPAIGEFAELLHHRLVGELHISHGADAAEWRTFLLLLARSPEELLAEGGIAKVWAAAGQTHFAVREIDYAEVLRERKGSEGADWDRIGDNTIAEFVAGSVVAERGASQRLALAFQALVPELERKERLLDLAKAVAQQTPMGTESGFNNLWHGAAELLTSYSDESFVSEEYARELSGSREQALEVERVSDDPPERIQTWLASVSDTAVRELDLALIQDLLRIEEDPASWQAIAAVASDELERRTLLGDIATAHALLDTLVAERGDQGRAPLRPAAESPLTNLARGPLIRHIVTHLRK